MRLLSSLAAVALLAATGCSVLVNGALDDKPEESAASGSGAAASSSSAGGASTTASSSSKASSSASSSTGGKPAKCGSDADCDPKSGDGICDTSDGECVSCLPSPDTCGADLVCGAADECVPGCKSDADCGALACDPMTKTCSGCASDGDCPAGTLCDGPSMHCVSGCDDAHACPSDFTCCGGHCANVLVDEANCGGCAKLCMPMNATARCSAGVCGVEGCLADYDDCDGVPANGCETDTRVDPMNCGSCGHACDPFANAAAACDSGQCTLGACGDGYGNCNGETPDGCETSTTVSPFNCGQCGAACDLLNANATCAASMCAVASCKAGFLDCDHLPGDGCEIDSLNDPANCGGCGAPCSFDHASGSCASGQCALGACAPGWNDCDASPADGCESDPASDPQNCGGCGNHCNLPNAIDACTSAGCSVGGCDPGFGDCDGLAGDGCEIDLDTSLSNCGSCNHTCSNNGGAPHCDAGVCGIVCAPNRADCDMQIDTGCEVDLLSNVNHCGDCTIKCPGASPTCIAGHCGTSVCPAGLGDCNGDGTCETDTNNDPNNCGGCGVTCSIAHGTAGCVNGTCSVASCDAGFDDCDGNATNGCEVNLKTIANCGGCGVHCAPTNAIGSCSSGACQIVACAGAFKDCDGLVADGCEVNSANDVGNCGACGSTCGSENGTPSCVASACAIACDSGFGDCDNDRSDGCEETLVDNAADCGGCGVTCSASKAVTACEATTCVIESCNGNNRDCDGLYSNGCEVNILTSLESCGACGHACGSANATPSCANGICGLMCSAGFADCDAINGDGCEAALASDDANCGTCGNLCLAGRTCSGGSCGPHWTTAATNGAPSPRELASWAAIGTRVFVWGGDDDSGDRGDGGIYDATNDTWSAVIAGGAAPSPRVQAAAVWNGTHVVVWGGGASATSDVFADGARFSPTSGWTTLAASPLSARRAPVAVLGKLGAVLVWGGVDANGPAFGGARYDDATDQWLAMSSTNGPPAPRSDVASAWSGKELVVFGGDDGTSVLGDGYAYNPVTDAWRLIAPTGALSARKSAFAVAMGPKILIYGGVDASGDVLGDGAVYDATADAWSAITTTSAPSPRAAIDGESGGTGWSGTFAILLGGIDPSGMAIENGSDYVPFGDAWTTAGSFPVEHRGGVFAWTGQEMFLWSGRDNGALVAEGDRYKP